MPGNGDLKIKVEPQNPRKAERKSQDAVTDSRAQLGSGYATLDRASTDEYGVKERQGLSRNANYPRRYC